MQLWPVAYFFSSKLDFPVIKTLEFHSLNVKKSLMFWLQENLNFDDKKWATGQSCIRKEITSYRIGSLGGLTINRVYSYWCQPVSAIAVQPDYPTYRETS